jgi:hypothetical protein
MLFESVRMWEKVVDCYRSVNQLEEAERVVRIFLGRDGKPIHHCLLGDVTRNPQHYLDAVDASDDQSTYDRTTLGKLSLVKKQFADAIPHFRRSLELQSFQLP